MPWVEVAIAVPLRRTFTYAVPPGLAGRLARGQRVLLPWRNGSITGVVLALRDALPSGLAPGRVKPVEDILDEAPIVPEAQLTLTEWLARYYHAPIGEAVDLAVPATRGVETRVDLALIDPEAHATSDLEALVIETLRAADDGRLSLQEVLSRSRRLRHAVVHALESRGVVRRHLVAGQERVRARTTTRVTPTGARPSRQPGERQEQVLHFLATHGETTADELRDLYQTPRSVLTSLARLGLVTLDEIEVYRDPFEMPVPLRAHAPTPTADQERAVATIEASMRETPGVTLLHGVTGSGKTEVYLRCIERTLAEGRRAIVLLPEIALTPQFVATFRSVLGDKVAVQHSGLTPGQRFDQWRRIRAGELPVVIGARSAIFAPVESVGLIVVDEEHDPSFKQDNGVPYHARDLAVVLGAQVGAAVVLGSATPSLESLRNAQTGRYRLAELAIRANRRAMPKVEVLDLATCPPRADDPITRYLSPPLETAVRDTVRAGNQAILFLNRRGFAPVLRCNDCGGTFDCPHCDVSLTWHRRGDVVRCHACGFSTPAPKRCPTCSSDRLERDGVGTERVEHEIAERFEGMRVTRLDADSARGPKLLEILDRFRRGGADLLIGTQMVTKGHDFPNVTLVGVLNADQSLRFPDFRSGERTFQLLTQVAGRAGRAEKTGRVIVQTWTPGHHVIRCAAEHDYARFSERELRIRERLGYPPFGHAAAVRFDGPDYADVARAAQRIIEAAAPLAAEGLRIVGPVDAPLGRVRGRYRLHALLLAPERAPIHRALARCIAREAEVVGAQRGLDLRCAWDVDPQSLL